MDPRALAEFVDYMLGRMEHMVRLASVTDVPTMARYLVALHMSVRPKFDRVAETLPAEPDEPLPN